MQDTQAAAPLTLTDRIANYESLLRELQTWCRFDGFAGRTDQAREYAETIERALAGEDTHILARQEFLEQAAASFHQLDSEHGYPALLRDLADSIEDVRKRLDASGYTEWNLIGGL